WLVTETPIGLGFETNQTVDIFQKVCGEGDYMRKLFLTLMSLLVSTALVFAEDGGKNNERHQAKQDRDDHNDSAPTQSGFAVITPVAATTSGTTTGLV